MQLIDYTETLFTTTEGKDDWLKLIEFISDDPSAVTHPVADGTSLVFNVAGKMSDDKHSRFLGYVRVSHDDDSREAKQIRELIRDVLQMGIDAHVEYLQCLPVAGALAL